MPRVYRPSRPASRTPERPVEPEPATQVFDFDAQPQPSRMDASDERMNAAKVLKLYAKLASTKMNSLVVRYNYADLRRMFVVAGSSDDEMHDVIVNPKSENDPLGAMLLNALRSLPANDRGSKAPPIELGASLAVLVEPDLRPYKPFALVAYDLGDAAAITACLTASSWVADESFSTEEYTDAYLRRHKLPIDANTLLIDVFSSSRKGVGTLLVLEAYLAAMRMRRSGVACVAVTAGGRKLFDALGFERHKSTELYYVQAGALQMAKVHAKLGVDGVLDLCWRKGLTPASAQNIIGRC